MQNHLHIALLQPNLIWEDVPANLAHYDQLLDALPMQTDLVVLPEMFQSGFTMNPHLVAEPPNSTTTQWMQTWAKRLDAAICGSIVTIQNNHYYNRLLWVMPSGEVHFYDKHHLFRMGRENETYTRGNTPPLLIQYKGWNICGLVCYDLRFPVWSRNHFNPIPETNTHLPTYDLLLYVANWPEARSHAWSTLLQARAIENLCFVAGCNRIGTDANNIYYSGDSAIIDFKGQTLVTQTDHAAVLQYTLSKTQLVQFRHDFPAWMDADKFELR